MRLSAVAAMVLTCSVPAGAGAQPSDGDHPGSAPWADRRPAIARFEGRMINLADGWGDATACLVWRQGGVLECFRDAEDLDALEARLNPRREAQATSASTATASASYSCWSSLRLYENTGYTGRRLSFWDRGFWQDLWLYGFDDQTSSYIVGGCYAHLAEYAGGGGWWYPGPTYPYAAEPAMGWPDFVSSIYLE